MKAKIDAKLLSKQIATITGLIAEANITATKDEISIVEMDPANVAMVIFRLHSSAITEYDVTEETKFAINLANLKTIVKRAAEDDFITLELEKNKLKVDLGPSRHFTLPTIDLEEKAPKIPELQFKAKVQMSTKMFEDAIADAAIVSESVRFTAENGILGLTAEGDLSNAQIDFKDNEKVKITADEKVFAKYSIEYLQKMVSSKIADELVIHFGKDYPLKLVYVNDQFSMSFILAPRVDSD